MKLEVNRAHNLFYGSNGSGKTSLLEAVHLLGLARSFRPGGARSLIRHASEACTVFGELARNGHRSTLAVRRQRDGDVALRINHEPVRLVSQMADELPVIVLNSASFDLLLGQPELRRRFLDWGVFHVEHGGREHWQRFQRALTQRNHLLRRDNIGVRELEAWNTDLAEHAEAVSSSRERFLQRLAPIFSRLLAALAPAMADVSLHYRRGWDAELSFLEALGRAAVSDRERGFTQSGPQRADLRLLVNGYPAAETLSRGQQKLVVCALKLAQGQLLSESESSQAVYLVDDIAAELDSEHVRRVCEALHGTGAQTLVTCIERDSVLPTWFGSEQEPAVFHVKQGTIARQSQCAE